MSQQLTTVQDIETALDRDVTLSSFAIALQNRVMGASIKYNIKYQIYKLEVEGDIVVRANGPELIVNDYNDYYIHACATKRREA